MAGPKTADKIARSLRDEIARPRLIELLDQRWHTTLTLVSAPGGYGKTRALAQAVDSNQQDPVGIEFYLRLRPVHADPTQLAVAILEALGALEPDGHGPAERDVAVERVRDQFALLSPSKLCFIIDDVHLIEASPSSSALLADLVRALPTNAHLVLCGRSIPELPLARLRADDALTEVGSGDLVFDDRELDLLADQHGVEAELLSGLAGWPALVRLAVVAGKTGPREYLMQEIVNGLAPDVVQGLTVAALAGVADDELFRRCDLAMSASRIAEYVPLVDTLPSGEIRPHDLWADILHDIADSSTFAELVEIVAPWHTEQRRHDEAIALATSYGTPSFARAQLMHALDGSDLRLQAAWTERWLDLFGAAESVADTDAEVRFLRGWHQRLAYGPGHGDDDVEAALHLFHERGDVVGEAHASVEHAFRGFLAGEIAPILDAVERSPRLVEQGVTYLQPLGAMTHSIISELGGDFEQALQLSQQALVPGVRPEFAELALRHRSTLFFLVGDGDAAVVTTQDCAERFPTPANELLVLLAQFANGKIDELVDRWAEVRYYETGNVREDFVFLTSSVFIDACLGLLPEMERIRVATWDRPREQMQFALCEWCYDLINGDEAMANERLANAVERLGLDDPLVVGEVRRFIVSGYVAVPAIRTLVDDPQFEASLGRYHQDRLALARLLVALRDGATPNWSALTDPQQLICSMSLPWSVEIVCGLALHDEARALDFADALFRAAGARAQDWIRTHAESDGHVAAGAQQLLRLLPAPPSQPTVIRTQPTVALERDGETTAVSRARVRQLLLLLLLRESVTRETAMTLLWPDKDIDKARNNLRITLSHLRSELEPQRRSGEPSFHLRQRGDTISLHRSDYLQADVWQIRAGLEAAEAARSANDVAQRLSALASVAELWEPPMFDDLVDVVEVEAEATALQMQMRDVVVTVAESRLAEGCYDEAARLARKLLRHDGYDERAHAITIASLLDAGHEQQARLAIDECLAKLADLEVSPAPATRMLLRRAQYPEDHARRTA